MSNNKWSEQKIDELLSQVPKLQDTRSKEEVLNRLLKDPQLSRGSQKQRKVWLPSVVSVAALFTLILVGVIFINQSPAQMDNAFKIEPTADPSTEMSSSSQEANISVIDEGANLTGDSAKESSLQSNGDHKSFVGNVEKNEMFTSVYSSDMEHHTAFQIGLISKDALVVPITFLIPNEQIQIDFGTITPNTLQLYQKYAEDINEESLGFVEYHPYDGKFKLNKTQLIHQLPNDHKYDLASASLYTYIQSLQYTFNGFSEVVHQNEDGSPAEFNQVGYTTSTVLMNRKYRTNVYPYKDFSGNVYMIPNLDVTFESVSDAIIALKTSPNYFYQSVIPNAINFSLEEENGIVHINFSEPFELNSIPKEQVVQILESFVLTAANYDTQIQINNVVPDEWNDIDLSHPLEQPVRLNKSLWP